MRSKVDFLKFCRAYSSDSHFNEVLSIVKNHTKKKSSILTNTNKILPRFQVISNEEFLKSKSFYIELNNTKYLFNCNELLNRHLLQYNLQNTRFENIFITQKSWSCISGLTSYIQACRQQKTIRLHAPYNLKELLDESNFVLQFGFSVIQYHDYEVNEVFKDVNLSINVEKIGDMIHLYYCKTKNGFRFLVLDCPNEKVFHLIKNNSNIANLNGKLDLVVHLSDLRMFNNKEYLNYFTENFKTQIHLYFNNENLTNCSSLPNNFHYKTLLNYISPHFFPILGQKNLIKDREPHSKPRIKLYDMSVNRKFEKFQTSTNESVSEEIQLIEDFIKSKSCHNKIDAFKKTINDIYPQCTFLGTSSSVAQKNRNHSGIVVNLTPKISILLECGEGILNQFVEYYGEKLYKSELKKIRALYISHFHIDHHIGLLNFLEELLKYTNDRVYLCLPNNLIKWLKIIDKAFYNSNLIEKFEIINNEWLTAATQEEIKHSQELGETLIFDGINDDQLTELKILKEESKLSKTIEIKINEFKKKLDVYDLMTFPVNHVSYATGIKIKLKNQFELVFSGDTRPSVNLMKYAKNCDLLIHEATYNDLNLKRAKEVWHSTNSEVIEISEAVNPKHVILTHFHGFLNKPENVIDIIEPKKHQITMALDFFTVNRSNLHLFSDNFESLKDFFTYFDNKF